MTPDKTVRSWVMGRSVAGMSVRGGLSSPGFTNENPGCASRSCACLILTILLALPCKFALTPASAKFVSC